MNARAVFAIIIGVTGAGIYLWSALRGEGLADVQWQHAMPVVLLAAFGIGFFTSLILGLFL